MPNPRRHLPPSPVVGEAARGVVEGLKDQPAVLALTVANLALLAFIFYALHSSAEFRDTMLQRMFELQTKLAACAPTP